MSLAESTGEDVPPFTTERPPASSSLQKAALRSLSTDAPWSWDVALAGQLIFQLLCDKDLDSVSDTPGSPLQAANALHDCEATKHTIKDLTGGSKLCTRQSRTMLKADMLYFDRIVFTLPFFFSTVKLPLADSKDPSRVLVTLRPLQLAASLDPTDPFASDWMQKRGGDADTLHFTAGKPNSRWLKARRRHIARAHAVARRARQAYPALRPGSVGFLDNWGEIPPTVSDARPGDGVITRFSTGCMLVSDATKTSVGRCSTDLSDSRVTEPLTTNVDAEHAMDKAINIAACVCAGHEHARRALPAWDEALHAFVRKTRTAHFSLATQPLPAPGGSQAIVGTDVSEGGATKGASKPVTGVPVGNPPRAAQRSSHHTLEPDQPQAKSSTAPTPAKHKERTSRPAGRVYRETATSEFSVDATHIQGQEWSKRIKAACDLASGKLAGVAAPCEEPPPAAPTTGPDSPITLKNSVRRGARPLQSFMDASTRRPTTVASVFSSLLGIVWRASDAGVILAALPEFSECMLQRRHAQLREA